jgi:hypothetical protein
MIDMNVWPISAIKQDGKSRCANCGKPISEAREILTGRLYDGEFACCRECDDEHEELGSPIEHGIRYRDLNIKPIQGVGHTAPKGEYIDENRSE